MVCYPSNPTATVASLDFYKDLVLFAKKHEIFVLSDIAYAEVYFDDEPPPSILQAPGAFEVAVEFTSMSKTFSMAGWRIGFAVGNERLLAALGRVKSYLDYGAYTPIQVAAAAALNGPDDCVREMRATYKRRRDVMIESFAAAGWPIEKPSASMFAWTPVPERFRHLGSLEFAKLLIEKADVAVAPGVGFGEHGDDYVRLALVENEQRIRQAARGVTALLRNRRRNAAQCGEAEKAGVSGARTIVFAPQAAREIDGLDAVVRARIERVLDQLAIDPLMLRNQIKRLKGDAAMRLRVGDWRVIFDLRRGEIAVLAVAHRREVYRSET